MSLVGDRFAVETPSGVLAPKSASAALAYVRSLGMTPPLRLPSDEEWQRFAAMADATLVRMRELGREKNKVGAAIAKKRRAAGRREVFPIDSPPTTEDPDWRKKWPWMEAKPGEWRSYLATVENGVSIADLVRIQPGEEPDIDAVQAQRDELVELLRLEIGSYARR